MVTISGGVGFVVLVAGLFGIWKSIGARTDRLAARTERVETRLGDRIGRVEKRLMDAFYQALEKPDIGLPAEQVRRVLVIELRNELLTQDASQSPGGLSPPPFEQVTDSLDSPRRGGQNE